MYLASYGILIAVFGLVKIDKNTLFSCQIVDYLPFTSSQICTNKIRQQLNPHFFNIDCIRK